MTQRIYPTAENLHPLPDLPVVRDLYCDQAMTDQVTHYLIEKRPDLVAKLAERETDNPDPW